MRINWKWLPVESVLLQMYSCHDVLNYNWGNWKYICLIFQFKQNKYANFVYYGKTWLNADNKSMVSKTSRIHPVYVYLNMIYTPTNTNAIHSPSPLKLYIFLLFIGNIHTQAY